MKIGNEPHPDLGLDANGLAHPRGLLLRPERKYPRGERELDLVANDLADAMSIFTLPVVLGGGKKLFADGSAPHSFKLTGSRVSSTGVLVGHYERDGGIKIVDGALDSPSKREIARQERMKRED
jgi:hypothetical protein